MTSNGVPNTRFSTEPRQALLTPSTSPSVGPTDRRPPTKRPRLRSTPSSSVSATPSTSNESMSSPDVNSARRASTLRVLNVWAQLAERYNKRLDEDDIIDLYSGAIIKDRGVVRGASRDYHIGHFVQPDDDQDYPDADQEPEDSEQDDDENELNAPPSEVTTDDDAPVSKRELLRGVPPLSATTDAEDLKEFMEAEKRRRELIGGEEEEEDISPERLSALRKVLEEHASEKEAATANQAEDVTDPRHSQELDVDATPTRRVLPPDESEDELALWTHDESTAIYPVAHDESERDMYQVKRKVTELADSDSDKEFEAILALPPRSTRTSPLSVPRREKATQPPQSSPNSDRGRPKSRTRSYSNIRSAEMPEVRPRSSFVPPKPVTVISHQRKSAALTKMSFVASDSGESDDEVIGHISTTHKGEAKENSASGEDNRQERIPKSLGVTLRGRKRKRIASSSTSAPLSQSPEPKSSLRSHGKSMSVMPLQSDTPTLDKDLPTPVRLEYNTASSLHLLSSASKTRHSTPAYRSRDPEMVQSTSHDRNSSMVPFSDLSIPVTLPYLQRHPSHTPSMFSSPSQGTPGLSFQVHPPPPLDPLQAQQAHLLLAQAVQQLSYLISATVPSYSAYGPNPGQPWHHPAAHDTYSTPTHHLPHIHGTAPYHTPSSSAPLSSPVQTSVLLPIEEQHSRSRGRSKSWGRRVSFKLDDEKAISNRDHNLQPELHQDGTKTRKLSLDVKRGKEKGKATEESNVFLRTEDQINPSQEISRGRTLGPPDRKKKDVPRGRLPSHR